MMCASTPLLFRFRGYVRQPCLVPCDYAAQEVISLLTVSCQNGQLTGLPFHLVFIRKHLFGTQHEHNFRKRSLQTQFHEDVTVKFVENADKVTKW
jgi:hypothetical protein